MCSRSVCRKTPRRPLHRTQPRRLGCRSICSCQCEVLRRKAQAKSWERLSVGRWEPWERGSATKLQQSQIPEKLRQKSERRNRISFEQEQTEETEISRSSPFSPLPSVQCLWLLSSR